MTRFGEKVMKQLKLFNKRRTAKETGPPLPLPRMTRITWHTLPVRDGEEMYRGRVTFSSPDLLQAIITHTSKGYDLGWHRLIRPCEILCVKKRWQKQYQVNLT
jgi:hypothetical protein